MSSIKIVRTSNEDYIEIRIKNGKRNGRIGFNHDDHGWDGMHGAENLAREIATVLDVKFEDMYVDEYED